MATILVADDNSNIQKMVTLALKDQGIAVFAVGNGEAAVRKLPDVDPDLVLADIFMPVRNGYEVCEFVKSDARYAHIPVILLVGKFDPFDEREAQRVGADGVLQKPFVPPDPLITMVKSVLAKTASHQAVPVGAPASATGASDSVEMPATPERASLPEAEEFPPTLRPLRFTENESPLAFRELLRAPAVETDPDPVGPEPREGEASLPATGFGEMRFWHSPSAAEEVPAPPEAPAWIRPEPSRPLSAEKESVNVVPETPVAAEPREDFSPQVPVLPMEPPSPSEVASAVSECVDAAPSGSAAAPALVESESVGVVPQPPVAADAREGFSPQVPALPMEPPSPSEVASAVSECAEAVGIGPAEPPAPATEKPAQEPLASAAAEPSPVARAEEPVASNWPEPLPKPLVEGPAVASTNPVVPTLFPNEPPPPAPVAQDQPTSSGVSELAVPQALEPFEVPAERSAELVDRIVARVVERMQAEIVDIVTREILRPVAEALVRRELEKR